MKQEKLNHVRKLPNISRALSKPLSPNYYRAAFYIPEGKTYKEKYHTIVDVEVLDHINRALLDKTQTTLDNIVNAMGAKCPNTTKGMGLTAGPPPFLRIIKNYESDGIIQWQRTGNMDEETYRPEDTVSKGDLYDKVKVDLLRYPNSLLPRKGLWGSSLLKRKKF